MCGGRWDAGSAAWGCPDLLGGAQHCLHGDPGDARDLPAGKNPPGAAEIGPGVGKAGIRSSSRTGGGRGWQQVPLTLWLRGSRAGGHTQPPPAPVLLLLAGPVHLGWELDRSAELQDWGEKKSLWLFIFSSVTKTGLHHFILLFYQ